MKDVPAVLPEELEIAAVLPRADPRDALVSNSATTLEALPASARIGTSSLRRSVQLKQAFPGFRCEPLRGNVDTRLARLDQGDFDAIILATAGLDRLGLTHRIAEEYLARSVYRAQDKGRWESRFGQIDPNYETGWVASITKQLGKP